MSAPDPTVDQPVFSEFDEPHRFGVPSPVVGRRLIVVRGMTPCEACDRTGRVAGLVCSTCAGDGWHAVTEARR